MSSATDELRRLLDERGVEYRTHGTTDRTWFEVGRISWFIYERENGNFTADAVFLTPAQAIAATLGSGTCRYEIAFFGDGKAWFACSECGGMASADYDPPKYCPHCGRKVVDE